MFLSDIFCSFEKIYYLGDIFISIASSETGLKIRKTKMEFPLTILFFKKAVTGLFKLMDKSIWQNLISNN